MSCARCLPMFATSERQLETRQRNMAQMPEAVPFTCPGCGSTEWATSREMIKQEPKRKWIEHPRIFHWMRIAYIVTGAWCLAFGLAHTYFGVPGWWDIGNMFLAGFNIQGAINCTYVIRNNDRWTKLLAVCDEQQAMLKALVENRIEMHIAGIEPEDPPLAPRLH